MPLLSRLLGHFRKPLEATRIDDLAQLRGQVAQLREEVRELSSERVALLAEWLKTRDQVLKHLQRAAQIQKLEAPADSRQALAQQVLSLKLGGPRK